MGSARSGSPVDTDDALSRERRVGEESARVAAASPRIGGRPDEAQRCACGRREPGAQFERGPVVVTAAERNEDARTVPRVDRRAGQHGQVGRRALGDRREVACDLVRIEEDELDVVVRRQTDDVARGLQGGEHRCSNRDLERLPARAEGDGGRRDLALLREQPCDQQRPVREPRERLGDRQQGLEPISRRGSDEQRALHRSDRPRSRALQLERRILRQDAALELVQRRRRLDAELLHERLARPPVDVERLGLASRPVEREHQLPTETLAQRMVPHERFELRQHGSVASERELRLETLLERGEPQLLEPRDRGLGERLVREIGERCSTPEPECTTEHVGGGLRVGGFERLGRVVRSALEAVEIEVSGLDVKDVARRSRLDRLRAEGLPQLRDLALNLRHRGDRRRARVEVVGEPLHGDDAVCAQQQDRKRGALLRPTEPDRTIAVENFERSEETELEHPRRR